MTIREDHASRGVVLLSSKTVKVGDVVSVETPEAWAADGSLAVLTRTVHWQDQDGKPCSAEISDTTVLMVVDFGSYTARTISRAEDGNLTLGEETKFPTVVVLSAERGPVWTHDGSFTVRIL